MALTPSDFNVGLSPDPKGIVVGMNGDVTMSFSNTSLTERGYNLTVQLVIPDGASFVSSTIAPTSVLPGPLDSIIVSWTNIKDLAPNEVDFSFQATLKADETFRSNGNPVPFDVPIPAIVLSGTVDTLPRGNDDPGNVKITKTDSSNFIPLRYDLKKSAPAKMPKGAGLLSPAVSPLWPYEYTLTVMNNSRSASVVTLIDDLPNGVRYLNNLTVTGPDSAALSSPTVIYPVPSPGCQNYVTLDWGTVTLSLNSVNVIKFDAAIWDNFTVGCAENSGSRIPHMTPLTNTARLDGLSGPVEANKSTNAMDAVIDKSVASTSTDVGDVNLYTLRYRINQYDDVGSFVITDTISNGQSYNTGSASLAPDSVTVNPDGTTVLVWNLGLQTAGSSETITFSTTTDAIYAGDGPVSADDSLDNNVDINGINQTSLTATPDSSSAGIKVYIPNITKELLNYFYKDGTLKTYSVAAPGDEVEFRITYSSVGLTAQQRAIEIDEYAPLNMGPLTAALPVVYGGTLPGPFAPFTVSPNGLRWTLGTLPGNTLWTATFKVPVQNIDFTGARNNLAKLAGINTDGFAYSDRDQVEVVFGQPDIIFGKTVSGPNINAIKAGETYTYSITVSNPQNVEGNVTDAFEMDLTDIIPNNLTYNGSYSVTVTGTGTYSAPVFSGQNVSMTINRLAPGASLTFNYMVTVDPTVVAGSTLINNAILQRPYSQPDRSYQFPGVPFTDSAVLKAEGVTATKLITPLFAKIGDEVTYILQVTIPLGTTAYNVKTVDTFPDATQDYVPGSATKDGIPIVPAVAGGVVTFPTIPFVDATTAAVTIIYAFSVLITGGVLTPPYIDNQTDSVTVSWDINNTGTPAVPFTTSAVLQVRTPFLTGTKTQRNATTGGGFTTSLVSYTPGDIVQYRITVQNGGAETAFNSVITDVINPFLSFIPGSIIVTTGSASVAAGTLIWNIPQIAAGGIETLTFSVTTLPGVSSDGRISDSASFVYNTNNNGFGILLGPAATNTVQLRSPRVNITKSAFPTQGEIGDDITYSIIITVPNDTVAYAPTVDDTLPVGQTYIGPATRQQLPAPPQPVVPTVSGQNIAFPANPDIDAAGGDVTIIYTFIARITNAIHIPPYQETQTDTARVRWAIESGGSLIRNRTASVSITARTPNIIILKEQRNVTAGGSYTTAGISALPGNIIYYRFTITSNGASPAFNINLNDVLSDDLTYNGIISGPTAGTVTPPAPPPAATLVWNIPQLNNGLSAALEFSVTVNSGVAASSVINDLAAATYDSNDVNPITYPAASNQVTINIPALGFSKASSTGTAAIGNTITYTLTVDIPNGVAAYNLQLKDGIPLGQAYVPGSWAPGTPVVTPNEIIYNEPVSPLIGPQTLVFTFNTVVVSGNLNPPFTQIQTNIARVTWDLTPAGPSAPPVPDSVDVEIRTPNIVSLKEQRNVTQGGAFTTNPLIGVATGNTVEYRITLTNNGAGTAYNVVTTDPLDPSLTYIGVVAPPPPGTVVSSVPPGNPDGTVTWTEASLNANASVALVFSVLVNAGPPPGTAVFDHTSTVFDTAMVNPTTLGPVESNQVAFNYNNPVIIKTVDDSSVFVGDTVTYTVAFTIPNGNIAYDVQVTDTLPTGQSYAPDSLTRNGIPIIPSPTLTFPNEGTVDATAGAVTITYTFRAVVNSIASPPQEEQLNSATINWNIAPGGPAGTPQTDTAGVFVTSSDITVVKTQRNFTTGVPALFTSSPVDVSTGDVVYYQLSVTNPGSNAIYHVSIDDVLSPFLQFNGTVTPPDAGIITHTGEPQNGTVNWNIITIPASTTYTAVFSVTVLSGAGAQSTIPNTAAATFTATSSAPIVVYGPRTSNTVELILPSLILEKGVSKTEVQLGEVISYTLQLTVPAGTIAYNVVVSDTLPSQQAYAGNAARNGIPAFPTLSGQTVTFGTESIIDASAGEIVILYSFDARPVQGNDNPPYTQLQTDNTAVNWLTSPGGTPAVPSTAQQSITVVRPFVEIGKQQRTVTRNSGFTTDDIPAEAGDIVEFKLTASNSGASDAYDVVLADVLGNFLDFITVVSSTKGTVVHDSITNTLVWIIDSITSGDTEELVFAVQLLPGIPAGGSNSNQASAFYGSNELTPIILGPVDSNIVKQIYPNVQISKSAAPIHAAIGDIITYTVDFLLPAGTVAYNGQFTDIIPIGQIYNNNATLNGVPVVPVQIIGQFIAFPAVPFADATGGALNFAYKFESLVVTANVDPVTLTEIQTNEAQGHWFLDSQTPAPSVNGTADITVSDSSIITGKEQRNVSTGGIFTASPINAFRNDIAEYSLTVTNTGSNTIYDVILVDVLSGYLSYQGAVSVPVGTLLHSGEPSGGTVTWTIPAMNPGDSLTAVFSASVLVGILISIENKATSSFRISPDNQNRYGTTQVTNTTLINVLPPLGFDKTVSVNTAAIGDTVTYTLTVDIPAGVTVYNLEIKDEIPLGQQYIPGSWSPGTPFVSGNEIIYSEPISPLTGPQTLIFIFSTIVVNGNLQPPYTQQQTNAAEVHWDLSPIGPPAPPVSASAGIEVLTPDITALKEQRNVTKGGAFTTGLLLGVATGDIVEYKITLTNNGAGAAYNIVTTDPLDPSLTYLGVTVPPPPGVVVSSVPAGTPDGTLTWTKTVLAAGASVILTFSVLANAGPPPGTAVFDQTSTLFNTAPLNPTTLGPVDSNQVGFNYTELVIIKTVNDSSVFVEDTVTYTVAVTIPNGNIAYDVQVTDSLPAGQNYVPDSLTRNGVPIIPSPVLVFPYEGTVNAVGGAVTITYTFEATVNSISTPPQQEQTDTATVNWNIAPGGPAGTPQTGTATVFATDSDIIVQKAQRNFTTGIPVSFTAGEINASVGDILYYELSVTNPSPLYAIYHVSVEDVLSGFLKYNGVVAPPDAGIVIHTGEPSGGTVNWLINSIPPLTAFKAVIAVSVLAGGAQSTIPDSLSAVFTATATEPLVLYGPRISNTVLAELPSLQFTKSASPATLSIGDIVTYQLVVTVPQGVNAYNTIIKDKIPAGQQYVTGSWFPGTPSAAGNEITFNVPESPVTGPRTLIYTFNAVVVSGNLESPFTQTQRNNGSIIWDISPQGPQAIPVSDFVDVEVRVPSIISVKQQRNATQGGAFTTDPLSGVTTGDIVEYRLTLTNVGASTAYNIVTSDILDPSLTFTGVVAPPPSGTVISSVPLGNPDGTVTWTESILNVGFSALLTFSVLVNAGPPPGTGVFDRASTVYDTAPQNPETLGPVLSNQVAFNYNEPVITKTVDDMSVFIGDTVTYTVAFTIPNGNIAYNIQVTDTLPPEQSYVQDSLTRNGIPLLPSPSLVFPNEGTVDATGGAVTITYTFKATVNSISTPPQQEQTDTATINWNISPGGPAGEPQTATVGVFVTNSGIVLLKGQRNITTSGTGPFTSAPVRYTAGDTLYYRLSVTNPGTDTIYNINTEDILSDNLQYNGPVIPPDAGIITHTGELSGGTVSWVINSIPPGITYNAVISVTVLPTRDSFQATFAATGTQPVVIYGPVPSNTVVAGCGSPALGLEKRASSNVAAPGQTVTYTIELVIPQGTIAYNLQVLDVIPDGQVYADNATRNGLPATPAISGQAIVFIEQPVLNAFEETIIITYTFDVRVTELASPPYKQVQTDNAAVYWEQDPQGNPGVPSRASAVVHTITPFLEIEKEQRNVSTGGGFTKEDIVVKAGDIVEYRISINNAGTSPAYNVAVTDALNAFNIYSGVVSVTSGNVSHTVPGNIVSWTLDTINQGSSEILVFAVITGQGTPPRAKTVNAAFVRYDTNQTEPVHIGPVFSNVAVQKYPNLQFVKSSNASRIRLGDTITYNLAVTVEAGSTAYNVIVSDIIPWGQKYAGNARRNGQPIQAFISGNIVMFPAEPLIDASSGQITINYSFDVKSQVCVKPKYGQGIQTDTAFVEWAAVPADTPRFTANANLNIVIMNCIRKKESCNSFYVHKQKKPCHHKHHKEGYCEDECFD